MQFAMKTTKSATPLAVATPIGAFKKGTRASEVTSGPPPAKVRMMEISPGLKGVGDGDCVGDSDGDCVRERVGVAVAVGVGGAHAGPSATARTSP
jgi:hypothetical protein